MTKPPRADMALPDVPIPSDTEEQPIDGEYHSNCHFA